MVMNIQEIIQVCVTHHLSQLPHQTAARAGGESEAMNDLSETLNIEIDFINPITSISSSG